MQLEYMMPEIILENTKINTWVKNPLTKAKENKETLNLLDKKNSIEQNKSCDECFIVFGRMGCLSN